MKKTLVLALGACILSTIAYSQPFKQTGGEKNLQILFAPLSDSPFSLNGGDVPELRFRKFNATGTSAWRIGFSIGSSKSTDVLVQAADTGITGLYQDTIFSANYTLVPGLNAQADQRNSDFAFTIRPGYEMHFAGTDRLSPYWGAELIFTKRSTKIERDEITEGNYSVTYYDTTTVDPIVKNPYAINVITSKGGSTTFGINLVAGFDYYFAKNFSIGGELNFGYFTTSYADVETEMVKPTSTYSSSLNPVTFVTTYKETNSYSVVSAPDQKQGKDSGFGPGIVGQIKVGWLF